MMFVAIRFSCPGLLVARGKQTVEDGATAVDDSRQGKHDTPLTGKLKQANVTNFSRKHKAYLKQPSQQNIHLRHNMNHILIHFTGTLNYVAYFSGIPMIPYETHVMCVISKLISLYAMPPITSMLVYQLLPTQPK